MMDYLDFNDLKAVIIGLITGIGGFFICIGIQHYWSNRSIKSLKRRIEHAEASKAQLDNLAKSDRALIIHGFQAVVVLFGLLFIILGFQPILATKELNDSLNGRELLQLFLWAISSLICVGVVSFLQKIADHPKSLEKIDAKIAKLRQKLSANRKL